MAEDTKIISIRVDSPEDEELDEVDSLPRRNPFVRVRGEADPRVATCRGRLQNRRCQLNLEINKELRLRAGAENLFKATTNRKLRETVALELSFVNSNLQLLKEQLAELNSSVELYQSDSKENVMPMVPLGLKETKEIDFREPFKDLILEHYSEDAASYEDAISDFMDMRQCMRTPARSSAGVALLFKYYNQLYFIERRFFPPDRSLGIYFEWFDSLTGVPSCQRTVAFEKACVLFNMAGIYTQIGAKQERHTAGGLDGAVDSLLRAAGTLRYIHENFTNAPSIDLAADTLDALVTLMMAQARECLLDKLQLQAREQCAAKELELCDDLELCADLAQESAQLHVCYSALYQKMQSEAVFNYVPYSWVSLVHVKTEFYKGLAHHYCATGLLNMVDRSPMSIKVKERIAALHGHSPSWQSYRDAKDNGISDITENGVSDERMSLGRAHLREALSLYEEALRLQRMCRELRAKEPLVRVLRRHRDRAVREAAILEDAPDFSDIIDPPQVVASSKFQLSLTPPDFAQHRVEDLFKSLGPVAIFSAKRHWSAPRLVQLHKYQARRDSGRKPDSRVGGKKNESEIVRNGVKALRPSNGFEKREIEDYNLRSDEKYAEKQRIKKQNGVYINSFNNNSYYQDKKANETYVKTSTENGLSRLEAKRSESIYGNGKVRKTVTKNVDPLRRASSDYNITGVQRQDSEEGFGFSVRGDAPVIIAGVEPNSLADVGGMREGDFIVAIGERDVKWSSHEEVVRLIQQCGDTLTLKLVTPMDRNYLKQTCVEKKESDSLTGGSVSAASTASSGSAGAGAPRRAPSWNPFRRHRDTSSQRALHNNVIFR